MTQATDVEALPVLSDKDVWLLGGQRRFDSTVMPILTDGEAAYRAKARRARRTADIVSLPTDLPVVSLALRDWLDGQSMPGAHGFETKLSLLLRYAASPLRSEPLNVPIVHYPVSSFGGFYSCKVVLLMQDEPDQDVGIYRYLPEYHALELTGRLSSSAYAVPAGSIVACFVGQNWLVVDKYGEYAPYGIALDAGIVKAQFGFVTTALGWPIAGLDIEPAIWNQRLQLAHVDETVLCCATIQVPQQAGARQFLKATQAREVTSWEPPEEVHTRYPKLKQISDWFAAYEPVDFDHGNAVAAAGELPADPQFDRDVLQVMRTRSAGIDTTGFAAIQPVVDEGYLQRFVGVSRRLSKRRAAVPGEELLGVSYAWTNPSGPAMGLYDREANWIELGMRTGEFIEAVRDCLHSSRQYYNLSSMMFEMFITMDIAKVSAVYGKNSLRTTHLAAGAVVHDCCIAAAVFGCFARPVRMFRDAPLENSLRLDGQLIIQVLGGVNRHRNYSLALL